MAARKTDLITYEKNIEQYKIKTPRTTSEELLCLDVTKKIPDFVFW